MEPLRHATSHPAPRPVLELVEQPVKPVQTRRIRARRRLGSILAGVAAFLLIAIPMALHAIWGVTGSPVLTDSMRPAVNAGDLIVTRIVLAADLRAGQVAVLDVPGHSILAHRLLDVSREGGVVTVTTKGDANPVPEDPLTLDAAKRVPVMIGRIPAAGYVAQFFTRPEVLATGLGLLLFANVLTVAFVLYPRSAGERGQGKGGGA